jgi:hypothetical protein
MFSNVNPSIVSNTFISEACGFVRQQVYEVDMPTFIHLLAETYPFCERSTKCSVPFVRNQDDGFAFGDTPLESALGSSIEGQKTTVVLGLKSIATNGGGGMYNNAMNQAKILKALSSVGLATEQPSFSLPLVVPEKDQASFRESHEGLGINFEFTDGKPREAHIVSVNESELYDFVFRMTDEEGNVLSDNELLKQSFGKLFKAGLSRENISKMSYRNIHDKLPHISGSEKESVIDFNAFNPRNTVVINNMPPNTRLENLDTFTGPIEFRIGSNQLKELNEEVEKGVLGPISQLLAKSSIVFLNAEEAHKLFGMAYTGDHGTSVTRDLATKIKDTFSVSEVVISDEGRPVTYISEDPETQIEIPDVEVVVSDESSPVTRTSKDTITQIEIPDMDSEFSNALYEVLGQRDAESRIQNPTGCGDTLAPALQIAKTLPMLSTRESQLKFAVFWASVVYRISGSNLKDLPDAKMRDLMALYLKSEGLAAAA